MVIYKLASWLARRSGYAQHQFDNGWQVGYDDAAADLQEAEVGVPVFHQGPRELGYFADNDTWSD